MMWCFWFYFFCCRCCAAPPELPLRLPIALAINVERTSSPVLAIAVVAAGFQSLATLASPDLLDRSTTNEWRSSSPIPRHFCSSSPRNPYNTFSGSSRSCLAVGVAIYFFALLPPLRDPQAPCVAREKFRESRDYLRCNGQKHSAPSNKELKSPGAYLKPSFLSQCTQQIKMNLLWRHSTTVLYLCSTVPYRSCTKNTVGPI